MHWGRVEGFASMFRTTASRRGNPADEASFTAPTDNQAEVIPGLVSIAHLREVIVQKLSSQTNCSDMTDLRVSRG